MANFTNLDQVWLIVSPQNPLKKKKSMLEDYHRYTMVEIAVEDNTKLKASRIEFSLPKPSYTTNTLAYLNEKYPEHNFSLIMGEDNLRTLHKWKNYEEILNNHKIFVYPRVQTEEEKLTPIDVKNNYITHKNVEFCEAPVMKISASFIRKAIKDKRDVRYLLTDSVHKYLTEMNFYKK